MATPNPEELREALGRDHPGPWVEHLLGAFPAEYRAAFDAEALSRHLGLMRQLGADRPIRLAASRLGDGTGTWRVEVVGYDAFQLLATVCTLLAIQRLSIVEARIFTADPPPEEADREGRPGSGSTRRPGQGHRRPIRPGRAPRREETGPDRRRKVVDVFLIRPDEDAGPPDWSALERELSDLAQLLRQGQHDEVYHRLIGRFAAALGSPGGDAALESILLEIEPEGGDRPTRVHVRARDSFGFLSLTASALALSGLRIVRADVRTGIDDDWVDDTLWITDRSGRPVVDSDRLLALKYALVLIEHFSSRLPLASDPEAALVHFSRFANDLMARPDRAREFASLDRPEVLDALVRVLGESRFLWDDFLLVQPENVLPLIDDPERWRRRPGRESLAGSLADCLRGQPDAEARAKALQRFKDRELFRADIRTILGLSGGPEGFAAELTDVAEVLLAAALDEALERLGDDRPRRTDGRAVPVCLCALGKLGGRELGFASDLELMLVWDDRDLAPRPAGSPASDAFDRVVSGLSKVLGVRRGATFEPDFRLRPYGKGGPPATALSLFTSYYSPDGSAWPYERQALIRLRAVGGDPDLGRALEAHRDRYVYGPEPLDLDGLRSMRALQVKQLVRPGTVNAKFSPGALVDVEYAVQAAQIVRGREDPALRSPNTLEALAALERSGQVEPEIAEAMRVGYRFFRAVIGALRVVRGHADDLTVPEAGSDDHAMLARRLRWPDPGALAATLAERLEQTRRAVARLLENLDRAEGGRAGPRSPDRTPWDE